MKYTLLLIISTGAHAQLLDTVTQYDLDLARPQEKTLTHVIDRTITAHGRQALNNFLLHPTDNRETLVKRQQNLLFLGEYAQASTRLQESLAQIARAEPALISRSEDHLAEQALSQVYFTLPHLKKFNTNPYALDIAYGAHIAGLCAPLAEHVILHLGIDMLAHGEHDHDHHDHHHSCNHSHHEHHESNLPYYGLQALHWGLHIPGLYDMAQDIRHRALMVQHIHAQTIQIAAYIRAAQAIHAVLKEHRTDAYRFEPLSRLTDFFGEQPACSPEFTQLLTLLKKDTFAGQSSLWSHVGNVLAAYKLYFNVREEFDALIQAISEVDVYLSVAQLIQNQTPEQPWSFVALSTQETPELMLEDVRHLFITDSTPHSFSSETSRNVLITGDNGSGKSTYLTSIGHALVLAQAFGIVPARSCVLTPFAHIHTFRFIQDNMFEGISRFYAECARVDTIITTARNSSGFSCILLDEPYTYTTHEKGSIHLQEALTQLSMLNNTISFVATHYHDLDIQAGTRSGGFVGKNLP